MKLKICCVADDSADAHVVDVELHGHAVVLVQRRIREYAQGLPRSGLLANVMPTGEIQSTFAPYFGSASESSTSTVLLSKKHPFGRHSIDVTACCPSRIHDKLASGIPTERR